MSVTFFRKHCARTKREAQRYAKQEQAANKLEQLDFHVEYDDSNPADAVDSETYRMLRQGELVALCVGWKIKTPSSRRGAWADESPLCSVIVNDEHDPYIRCLKSEMASVAIKEVKESSVLPSQGTLFGRARRR